jgi:hypothetical protein
MNTWTYSTVPQCSATDCNDDAEALGLQGETLCGKHHDTYYPAYAYREADDSWMMEAYDDQWGEG